MAYCGPRGIPLSVFLAWDQDDQDAALGWVTYEGRRCRSCGYHPDEGAHHAHIDVCPGCVAVTNAADDEAAKAKGARTHLTLGAAASCSRCIAEREMNQRGA